MKTKCGFFIASICLWATGASFAHPGGHGEAVQLTAWQSAANAPGDLQLALVIFCAVIAALLFALVKTRGTLQKLAVGGTAALLILYACSGGDSPTQSAPDAPETNDSAPPPSPDPETDDPATETPGIDDSTTETPSDPVTTPSGDALANDPTAMAAAFAPYTKVDTRFDLGSKPPQA